jgi:hypothetical protein
MKTLTIAALGAVLGIALPAAAQEAPRADAAAPAGAVPAGALAQAPALAPPTSAPATAEVAPKTAPPVKGPTATFYGFANVQYARTDAPAPTADSGTFEIRRARIGAKGDVVAESIGYNVLFDAADTSLKDAFLAAKQLGIPGLELRAGQFKTPFGYEQPESDTKLLWVYSSYVVQALARSTTTATVNTAPDSRDVGAAVLGKWSLPAGLGAELAAAVTNGAGPNRKDDLNEKNAWGRAGLTAKAGPASIRAGASYGYGHQLVLGANGKYDGTAATTDDASFYFHTYGADVEVDSKWLFVAAEVIQSERDVRDHATGARSGYDARGWYAGVYGKTPWHVGPIFRAERYDRNRSAANDLNERYTVGAYADLLPVNARLIFNFELDESEKAVRTGNRAILFGQVIF